MPAWSAMCESLAAADFLLSCVPVLPQVLDCVAEMARNSSIAFGALEMAFEFLVVLPEKATCSWVQRKGAFF